MDGEVLFVSLGPVVNGVGRVEGLGRLQLFLGVAADGGEFVGSCHG